MEWHNVKVTHSLISSFWSRAAFSHSHASAGLCDRESLTYFCDILDNFPSLSCLSKCQRDRQTEGSTVSCSWEVDRITSSLTLFMLYALGWLKWSQSCYVQNESLQDGGCNCNGPTISINTEESVVFLLLVHCYSSFSDFNLSNFIMCNGQIEPAEAWSITTFRVFTWEGSVESFSLHHWQAVLQTEWLSSLKFSQHS